MPFSKRSILTRAGDQCVSIHHGVTFRSSALLPSAHVVSDLICERADAACGDFYRIAFLSVTLHITYPHSVTVELNHFIAKLSILRGCLTPLSQSAMPAAVGDKSGLVVSILNASFLNLIETTTKFSYTEIWTASKFFTMASHDYYFTICMISRFAIKAKTWFGFLDIYCK